MLSRLFLALYRWSLRRSGHQGTSIEHIYSTKAIKPEYTSTWRITGVGAEPGHVMRESTVGGPKSSRGA